MTFVLAAVISTAAAAQPQPSAGTAPQPQPALATTAPLTRKEIADAVEKVKADPNLATERTIKTLRWKESDEKEKPKTPTWPAWFAGMFGWVDQTARVLVWAAAILLLGFLLVYLIRTVRTAAAVGPEEAFVLPTHVRDLDIRPESLPDDVGLAARALWDRGEHRAALALLYRGMLSRLAHVHRVPIRDSSTEGDCLALAATHLALGAHEYVSRLVTVWQRFVYGGEATQSVTVHGLCDSFALSLDAMPDRDQVEAGGAS
jgi:hypothetical protein